jgi:hypothetical protein
MKAYAAIIAGMGLVGATLMMMLPIDGGGVPRRRSRYASRSFLS